jgi:hypothetical protein
MRGTVAARLDVPVDTNVVPLRAAEFTPTALREVSLLYERMKQKDFDVVLETAVKECGVPSRERAMELLDAFLQWFALTALPFDTPLQMFKELDKIWHAMILNTAFYRNFCTEFIGRFVDHDPSEVLRDQIEKRKRADFTLSLVRRVYGQQVNKSLFALSEVIDCCAPCWKTYERKVTTLI